MSEQIELNCTGASLEVDGSVAILRLDRPKVNALTEEMQDACGRAALEIAGRPDVAALVIVGTRKVFAAGVDINELAARDVVSMQHRGAIMHESYNRVAACPKPVIAAINGFALGGGFELALCADIRIAATDATFGFPEIKLGVIPGAGGTQRLTRLVGPSRAKDLIFTGRFVKADEALSLGIVNQLVDPDGVEEAALAYARQFVGQASLAIRAAKECINQGDDVDLATGLAIERAQFAALFATEDKVIGMESFQANGPGKAQFTGR